MRVILVSASLLLLFSVGEASPAEPEPVQSLAYVIEIQTAAATQQPPLLCVEGVPYFQVVRTRLSDDKLPPPKPEKDCCFFELTVKEGTTTIKNLGPGTLENLYTTFAPKTIPGDDKSVPGYLSADFSTDPPSLKLETAPGKFSKWKIERGEKEHEWYVEIENGSGKSAWLAIDLKDVAALVPLGNKGIIVGERRRARLTYETKSAIRFRRIDGKD